MKQYGVYNLVEDFWEHDSKGDTFVFDKLDIAEAQCQSQTRIIYGMCPNIFKDGKGHDGPAMEVRAYKENGSEYLGEFPSATEQTLEQYGR